MKIEGHVTIEARNSITNELIEKREVKNIVSDGARMNLFFPSLNNYISTLLYGGVKGRIYLSEYSGTVDQTCFASMTNYALSSDITPTVTQPQIAIEALEIYPTQTFAGMSPTRTLRVVGLYSRYGANLYITAVSIDPPITHDSSTTLFIHYVLRIYLDPNDNVFGYEVLGRAPRLLNFYRTGSTISAIELGPHHVGLPGYKKQFLISLIAQKSIESADKTSAGSFYLFKYNDDDSFYAKKGSISVPQNWAGPIGGVYELRNSSLCAASMYDPHMSRVFAHINSVTDAIFYDESESDVPESEGAISVDYENVTEWLPFAYQINFRSDGDVSTSTYNVKKWICPNMNTIHFPGASLEFGENTEVSGNHTYGFCKKQFYVSGNREWRAHKNGTWFSPSEFSRLNTTLIGYKNLERPIINAYTDQYCIRNDGVLIFTRGAHSTDTFSSLPPIGSLTLTIQSGCSYVAGNKIRVSFTQGSMVSRYVEGIVTSYIGTELVIDVTSVVGSASGTLNTWLISKGTTVIEYMDCNDEKESPTINTLCDLATELPSANIKAILGLCIDEDEGYLWISTDVGFVRCVIAESGGSYVTPYNFELFDHNTPDFGVYMTEVKDCTIYDPWNGRFTAERGTLTWVPPINNARIVWHWTGDRDARSVQVDNGGIYNLFVDYDLGRIAVTRNSNYAGIETSSPYSGQVYATIIRIGDESEGLVVTYNYNTSLNISDYGGYSCGIAQGKFWFISGGLNGTGQKAYIDLYAPTGLVVLYNPYNPQYYHGGSPSSSASIPLFQAQTLNRSLHPDVITYPWCETTHSPRMGLMIDSGPVFYGWNGSSWVKGDDNIYHVKHTHFSSEEISDNVSISFDDGGIFDSFRGGEYYSFGINPKGLWIDNLQTATIYISMYGYHANLVTREITVPIGSVYTIPEYSDPYFKNMAAWYRDPHVKVKFLSLSGEPVGQVVNSAPASTLQVQFNYNGVITFFAGHEGETVEIRYVWLKGIV